MARARNADRAQDEGGHAGSQDVRDQLDHELLWHHGVAAAGLDHEDPGRPAAVLLGPGLLLLRGHLVRGIEAR